MANYILKKKKRQIKVQHFNINLKILVKLMSMGKVFFPFKFGGNVISSNFKGMECNLLLYI